MCRGYTSSSIRKEGPSNLAPYIVDYLLVHGQKFPLVHARDRQVLSSEALSKLTLALRRYRNTRSEHDNEVHCEKQTFLPRQSFSLGVTDQRSQPIEAMRHLSERRQKEKRQHRTQVHRQKSGHGSCST